MNCIFKATILSVAVAATTLAALPAANAGDRDWRRYYSDADATLVAQLCAVDIARFGYRFDPEAGG